MIFYAGPFERATKKRQLTDLENGIRRCKKKREKPVIWKKTKSML